MNTCHVFCNAHLPCIVMRMLLAVQRCFIHTDQYCYPSCYCCWDANDALQSHSLPVPSLAWLVTTGGNCKAASCCMVIAMQHCGHSCSDHDTYIYRSCVCFMKHVEPS